MQLTIAGIGTDVGKTVVSAIFCEAFGLDYWKPVQAGDLDRTDSDCVASLTTNCIVHDERYRLTQPMSPHAAAERDGISIGLESLQPPREHDLVVELAGGLMVPINPQTMMIDLVSQLGFPVVLVANFYLGSINHTLLSVELLKSRGVELLGVVFNGDTNLDSRAVILDYCDVEPLAEIDHMSPLTLHGVQTYAHQLRQHPSLAQLRP